MTDFCGLRIITRFTTEVEEVCKIITEEFLVDEERSEDKTVHAPREFGYMSKHYVVQVAEKRRQLDEWEPYVELYAEIQVRTVVQHAWAVIEHKVIYKNGSRLPQEVTRGFSQMSALLEVADFHFEGLLERKKELERLAAEEVSTGSLDRAELTISSLDVYLADSALPRRIANNARERHRLIANSNSADEGRLQIDKENLLDAAHFVGLSTVGQLDERLEGETGDVAERIFEVFDALGDQGEAEDLSAHDIIGIYIAPDWYGFAGLPPVVVG